MRDGIVTLPELPGIGFEGKADLYRGDACALALMQPGYRSWQAAPVPPIAARPGGTELAQAAAAGFRPESMPTGPARRQSCDGPELTCRRSCAISAVSRVPRWF